MTFTSNSRANVFAATSALVATFVRNIIQYHRYSWGSFEEFLGTWIVHYIAIVLCAGIAFAIAKSNVSSRLGASDNLRNMEVDDALVFGSLFILTASALMFIGAHVQSGED